LDPATRRVWRRGQEVELPNKAFSLLELFMRNPDTVLSRYELLEGAWDNGYENRSNVISVHIRQIRERIDKPFGLDSIETLRGIGYRMRKAAGEP
jgi:two-component system OmpR family response regulator